MRQEKLTILVAYASGTGSTGEVAGAIAGILNDENVEVVLQNVQNVSSLSGYNGLVLGSSIRAGRWLPEAVEFLEDFGPELESMPVALFTTCLTMVEDTPENRRIVLGYMEPVLAMIPKVVPVGLGLFAGSLNAVMQTIVTGGMAFGDYRDWVQIRTWAGEIKPQMLSPQTDSGRNVILSGHLLNHADLSGLELQGIIMQGAELRESHLERANLHGADLRTAEMAGADLRQADLAEAGLGWADLSMANLSDANLHRANLIGSILRGAILTGTDLSETLLNGADLTGADLTGANLSQADLNWAILRQANLQGTDLSRANLGWADLTKTNIKAAIFQHARYNEQTKWPKGFSPQSAGCILVNGPQ